MTISWWWVRHAPTHAKTLIGHSDMPADLSDTARFDRLNKFLPSAATMVSSDLIRAISTADMLAQRDQRLPNAPAFREINFGDWEGLTFDKIAQKDPVLSREYWENPGDVAPPNGESWDIFSQRIKAEITHHNATTKAENIIAVAHFGVILAALQHAADLPAKSVFSFKINNFSVTKLDFHRQSNSWSAQFVNLDV